MRLTPMCATYVLGTWRYKHKLIQQRDYLTIDFALKTKQSKPKGLTNKCVWQSYGLYWYSNFS